MAAPYVLLVFLVCSLQSTCMYVCVRIFVRLSATRGSTASASTVARFPLAYEGSNSSIVTKTHWTKSGLSPLFFRWTLHMCLDYTSDDAVFTIVCFVSEYSDAWWPTLSKLLNVADSTITVIHQTPTMMADCQQDDARCWRLSDWKLTLNLSTPCPMHLDCSVPVVPHPLTIVSRSVGGLTSISILDQQPDELIYSLSARA